MFLFIIRILYPYQRRVAEVRREKKEQVKRNKKKITKKE